MSNALFVFVAAMVLHVMGYELEPAWDALLVMALVMDIMRVVYAAERRKR